MPDVRIPSFNDFSPEILRGDLRLCLQAVVDFAGEDKKIYQDWAARFFAGKSNRRSTTNIPATLRSTGLSTGGRPLELSAIGKAVLAAPSAKDAAREFCAHLLREKNGKKVIEALGALRKRQVKVTKSSLKEQLKAMGVTGLSTGTTDHSTLRNWLAFAGLVSKEGDPVDEEIRSVLGISGGEIDELKSLSLAQQVFVYLLRKRHATANGPFQVTDLLSECMETEPYLFDESQFAKKVRQPLEDGGWVKAVGLAKGVHGGRSGQVSGTKKLLDIPVQHVIPDYDQVVPSDLRAKLNLPLSLIEADLFGSNKHKAGMALELLALRMIIDLRLDARHFRVRSAQTAFAEVDLIAEGVHLLFSRWTFQCKRYGADTKAKIGVGEVAKEVGIAIFAKAHVIVMVTTTDFSKSAKDYAREVSRGTHLQFVFVDGKIVRKYLQEGKEVLWRFFQENARTVMTAKREQPLLGSEP